LRVLSVGEVVVGPRALLMWVALVVVWLPGVGGAGDLMGAAAVAAVAVGAVALLLVWGMPDRSSPLVRVRARVLRERAQRLAFLRTRDPDADGRVRPRAPGEWQAAS
jgi:Family of unknown function (DUF6412)